MDELNYSGASEVDAGGAVRMGSNSTAESESSQGRAGNADSGKQRMRMVAGPNQGDSRAMNRADRRKMEKGKRN
jgi:hypothetical protein